MEKYKQPDLPGFSLEGEPEKKDTDNQKNEEKSENAPKIKIIMGGEEGDLNCEVCSDRPGGCAQCGWGRNR